MCVFNSSEQQLTIHEHVWFGLRVAVLRLWYCCVNVKTSTFLLRATCTHKSSVKTVAELSPRGAHMFLSEVSVT